LVYVVNMGLDWKMNKICSLQPEACYNQVC
jgi:hypothetical protein